MDEPRSPKKLEELWLEPEIPGENINMLADRTLLADRKLRDAYRTADIACIAVTVVIIPLVPAEALILGLGGLYLAGMCLISLLLAAGLLFYRWFYRGLREAPSPVGPVREHITGALEYLARRDRFFRITDRWLSPSLIVTAIPFAISAVIAAGPERGMSLIWVACLLPAAWLGHRMTNHELGRIENNRSRLLAILNDFAE